MLKFIRAAKPERIHRGDFDGGHGCLLVPTQQEQSEIAPYEQHLRGQIIALSFSTVGEQYAGYLRQIRRGKWPGARLQELERKLKSVVVVPYDNEICKALVSLERFGIPMAQIA